MKKYIIVPKRNYEYKLEADSPEDAIIDFATQMDTDMNNYFEVIEDPERDIYRCSKA